MYFAQEFIPLNSAILVSSAIVLGVIAIRSMTIMSIRLALLGIVLPAAGILAITIMAAIQTRLQGILITGTGFALTAWPIGVERGWITRALGRRLTTQARLQEAMAPLPPRKYQAVSLLACALTSGKFRYAVEAWFRPPIHD